VPNMQLDEYPPAMFSEGGAGASVRPMTPSQNMGAGSYVGNAVRSLPNGTQVVIRAPLPDYEVVQQPGFMGGPYPTDGFVLRRARRAGRTQRLSATMR